MKISNNTIKNISFLYIFLPVVCFFIGYLKLYISVPLLLVCFAILYFFFKDKEEESFLIQKKSLIIIICLSFIYIFLSGVGKLYSQATIFPDHSIRNTIFRDLIIENWPVTYRKGIHLCYYIGQYIVPSVIGKIVLRITSNEVFACCIGNICLYLYCVIGMILIFLWLIKTVNAKDHKKIIILLLMFIFFSGLDIFGFIINKKLALNYFFCGFEWWVKELNIQYASFTSLIYFSYNQAFVPILIFLMILNTNNYKYRMVLLVFGLLFGPYPILGTGLLFLARDIISCILKKSLSLFKKYISLPNILALMFIFPIFLLFFKANFRVELSSSMFNGIVKLISNDFTVIYKYFLFLLLEFLIYIFLIYRKDLELQQKIDLFIIVFFLSLFPLIGKADFVMRTSIPFILLMFINIFMFIFDKKSNIIKKRILIILLIIAAVNPLAEFLRGFRDTYEQGYIGSQVDELDIMRLNNYYRPQYISSYYNIFFDKLAKDKKTN